MAPLAVIHLDTSVLVEATTSGATMNLLRSILTEGHSLRLSTIALYKWLRGPRTTADIYFQEGIFPNNCLVRFDETEARLAADIYRAVRRARTREAHIAIAATAIHHKAHLWTLNPTDFTDIPGLSLWKKR